MKKKENMRILPLLIASAAIFYSCDKKEEVQSDTENVTNAKKDSVNKVGSITYTSDIEEVAAAVAANNQSEKPTLNPEHGQPYHRCEIPVGAPIDSAPPQNAAPQVMQQQNLSSNNFNTNPISPSAAPSPEQAQATGPKPANNPAHGEPHHRCDLEVGAPLT
ncbi:hypothetical protein Q73A0000_12925 [Kaistella flava (ex Peng et al. 2021)]|uniref:Uncharacterized protein n=1 Tax=Kaistella flava (ex Peng et al. 2021) TaxID=2038776 RepID=A0A7M2YC43_9FLAO|nr:hypothetical protein [Kaistella flava (ex Peng et al. 2021)]QOW11194.1 hypothetical protein Q73A0000_12925 [Kaistella flava (ex Peng et al. 2021)]